MKVDNAAETTALSNVLVICCHFVTYYTFSKYLKSGNEITRYPVLIDPFFFPPLCLSFPPYAVINESSLEFTLLV